MGSLLDLVGYQHGSFKYIFTRKLTFSGIRQNLFLSIQLKKSKKTRLKISNMFWFHIQQQLNNLNGVEKAKYIVEILVIRTQRQPD